MYVWLICFLFILLQSSSGGQSVVNWLYRNKLNWIFLNKDEAKTVRLCRTKYKLEKCIKPWSLKEASLLMVSDCPYNWSQSQIRWRCFRRWSPSPPPSSVWCWPSVTTSVMSRPELAVQPGLNAPLSAGSWLVLTERAWSSTLQKRAFTRCGPPPASSSPISLSSRYPWPWQAAT